MDDFPEDDRGGFREYVKNPEYARVLAREYARRENLPPPEDYDDASIRRRVERLLEGKPSYDDTHALSSLGKLTVPVLLETLEDPRFAEMRYGGVLDGSPLEVVLKLLEPHAPLEAIPSLTRLVGHENKYTRAKVACALGNIGHPDCVPGMRTALDDPEGYVMSFACHGIEYALSAGRRDSVFVDAMFKALVPHLERKRSEDGRAPRVLLRLDRERAIPVLLDERHFHTRNPMRLLEILQSLNEFKVIVPPERLLTVMDDLRPAADYFPGSAYGEALIALARFGAPEAEGLIREAIGWTNEQVKKRAVMALGMMSGIEDPTRFAYDRARSVGFEALTPPQKVYVLVFDLMFEVGNGGFEQYFVNSSGDRAEDACRALRTIGADPAEMIVRRALTVFGPEGPSPDRSERHEQLAALTADQDAALERLNREFWDAKPETHVALLNFARSHASHFGAGPS